MAWWNELGSSILDNSGSWAGLLGGGLSYLGSRENADANIQAAREQSAVLNQNADNVIAAGQPYGVGSVGGTADFDPDSKTAMLNLSPELQSMYQGALSRSGIWGDQLAQFSGDPFAAGNMFYEQNQPYYAEQEDDLRTDLETRLLAQGRLGSTGGRDQMSSLEEGILTGQTQRRNQGFSQAQALISALLGRESADIGTATGLLNVPMQQANLGMGISGQLGNLAAQGLASRASGQQQLSATLGASGSSMGDLLTRAGGLFNPPASNKSNGVTINMSGQRV